MKPNHHPHPETILAYGAGSVEESFSLLIAAHVERCRSCGSLLAKAERLAGSMLEELPRVAMNEDSISRAWARAKDSVAASERVQKAYAPGGLPVVLMHLLPDGLSGIKWRFMAPGIHQYRLNEMQSGAGSVRLLRIAPGVEIPEHTHAGTELTLILSGSYSDHTGRFGPGDLADLDDSVRHRPVVDSGQPCVCLVATDRPLQFTGALHRMLQPLLGI